MILFNSKIATLIVLMVPVPSFSQAAEIYGVNKFMKRMTEIYTSCDLQKPVSDAGLSLEVPQYAESNHSFVFVAVSGTLEEGFPLRANLDFRKGTPEEVTAIFLGKAFIRGLRACLDIKNPGSREYQPLPASNPVHPGMVPTGDPKDANIYSVYAVDSRQALQALLHEPRFLSMTPDHAKVDLHAEEIPPSLRKIILKQIDDDNRDSDLQNDIRNFDQAALLTVVSTWKSRHFVESPVLYTKSDRTTVTDFPRSLAKFAQVDDSLRETDTKKYRRALNKAIRQAVKEISAYDQVHGLDPR